MQGANIEKDTNSEADRIEIVLLKRNSNCKLEGVSTKLKHIAGPEKDMKSLPQQYAFQSATLITSISSS